MPGWFPDLSRWPIWQLVLAAIASLAGVVWIVQTPWRPWLGLLGLFTLSTVILGLDAWGLRSRAPLLSSHNAQHMAGGWGLVGGCLLVSAALALWAPGSPSPTREPAARLSSPPAALTNPPGVTSPGPVTPSAAPSPTPARSPAVRRTPRPRNRLSVTFPDPPLSAHPHQTVNLRVVTAPNTTCSISVAYDPPPSLDPAVSDGAGNVSWTWRVSNQAPAGSWPINVSCGGVSASTVITVV